MKKIQHSQLQYWGKCCLYPHLYTNYASLHLCKKLCPLRSNRFFKWCC